MSMTLVLGARFKWVGFWLSPGMTRSGRTVEKFKHIGRTKRFTVAEGGVGVFRCSQNSKSKCVWAWGGG